MIRLILALCLAAFPAFAKPNIVFIMVDDFSMNLMDPVRMPNLARMQRDGMTFTNAIVSNSLCCPSRTSILTGMLPHNSGVTGNVAPNGGFAAFKKANDDARTFALTLQAAGYQTALMGKYLNGWQPETDIIPRGWNKWVSTSKGYTGYGYTVNIDGALSRPPDHFTDLISQLGRQWIGNVQAGPFFLELSSFNPHSPYVPPDRFLGTAAGVVMPKTPAYDARPDANAPMWLQVIPRLKPAYKAALEDDYQLRVETTFAVDEMIRDVRQRVRNWGLEANTYIIFTSDNGYHMGEMSLRDGKKTPFDFDVRVPLVIVGPGVLRNSLNDALVQNIDFAPTFADMAEAPPMPNVDGRSILPLLTGGPGTRTMAAIEHVAEVNDPDGNDLRAGEPPTYFALHSKTWLYVAYDTGEVGYYDIIADPSQLRNIAATLSPARVAALSAALLESATCIGAGCVAAQNAVLP